MTHRTRLALLAAVPVLLLMAPIMALAAAPHAHSATGQSGKTVQVTIQNFAFSPQTITIAPGTTVVWTQKDSAPHTVTSDDNMFPASKDLSAGQTYSYTFTKTGKYAYHCAVHPNMTALVVVQAGGTAKSQNPGMGMMGPMSKTSVPTWTGWYDDHKVLFLSTDTSSKAEATSDHINYAPSLVKPLSSAGEIYLVADGSFAGRGPVFGSQPGDSEYTPLWQEVLVTWKDPTKAVALGSDDQIKNLAKAGSVTLKMTGTVLNCPIIKVLGG
jgi:plastocyanin